MKRGLLFAVSSLALACVSCGRGHQGLYPVHGKATYKGAPAVGAFVYLMRKGETAANESSIMGVVRDDGSFTLVCDAKGEGAPPGEYHVLIKWPAAGRTTTLAHKIPDRLQGHYADPRNPRWGVEVKAEANHLPPFELTD